MEPCVRFDGIGELHLEQRAVPEPGPGEVRIAPLAVGICGTDARILEGAYHARAGTILGHEIAGRVVALGRGVENVREGDLVSVEPHLYCGACRYCRLGWEHLCPDKRAFGVHLDGGMAASVVVPARLAYLVPLIIGGGPAGSVLLALARLTGVGPIVVVEPDAARRSAALSGGADLVLDPGDDTWQEQARVMTGGHGFDQVIEAAGSPDGLGVAIAMAARHARILVYGVAHPDAVVGVRPNDVYARELTILGAALNPYTHARAVELVGHLGQFPRSGQPTQIVDEAQRQRRHLKVIITPNV